MPSMVDRLKLLKSILHLQKLEGVSKEQTRFLVHLWDNAQDRLTAAELTQLEDILNSMENWVVNKNE